MNRTCLLVVATCGRASAPPRPPTSPSYPPRCYARDPSQPALPQGDVTHIRERLDGDRFDPVSIASGGRVTHVAWHRAGDHFDATLGEATVRLLPVACAVVDDELAKYPK